MLNVSESAVRFPVLLLYFSCCDHRFTMFYYEKVLHKKRLKSGILVVKMCIKEM